MRAQLLFVLLASPLFAACVTKRCADDTLFVSVSLDSASRAADSLAVNIDVDGTATNNAVKHTPSSSAGTIVVKFPHGYPSGKTVTITVIASAGGAVVGEGAANLVPGNSCDVVTVSVTTEGSDGGGDGGSPTSDGPAQGDGGGPDLRTVCPSGQQDNDGDGVCMPDCAHSGLICNATRQACSDASGTAMCVCTSGYVLSGSSCVWKEVPNDPTFQNIPPNSWTLQNGAMIAPTAPGLADPGNLVLSKASYCPSMGPSGGATQNTTIPTFAASEPLALSVTTELDCSTAGPPCSATYAAAIQLNGGVISVPYATSFTNLQVCLGERAYGGPLAIAVRPNDRGICAESPTTLQLLVDHLGIIASPNCPAPATIPDANFEAAADTWTFTPAGGTAALAAGMGVSGTNAGHIATADGCEGPQMANLASFPFMSMANAAITFSFKGTLAKAMQMGDGSPLPGVNWAEFTGDGTGNFSTQTVCVPEYVKGMVMPIRFSTITGNSCATPDVRDFLVDNLAYISSAACPATANILDGGFEQTTASRSYWPITLNANGTSGMISAGPVADAPNAHGGTQYLKMSISQDCTGATAETTITVPPPMGANGPAVHFYYKMNVASSTDANFTAAAGANSVAVPFSTTYAEKVLCLDPALAGQGVPLTVSVSSGGTCATTFPAVIGYFDDFDVSTDAACTLP